MKCFDHIFFRFYSFLAPRMHQPVADGYAVALTILLFFMPLIVSLPAYLHIEIPLPLYKQKTYALLLFSPLIYRYIVCKKYKANNYQIFREKWSNEPANVRRRRGWLILILSITNIVVFPIVTLVLSILHII